MTDHAAGMGNAPPGNGGAQPDDLLDGGVDSDSSRAAMLRKWAGGGQLGGPAMETRSMRDRYETGRRMPPLRDGRRDPDQRRPTDAPDEKYRLWQLAELLMDQADDGQDR